MDIRGTRLRSDAHTTLVSAGDRDIQQSNSVGSLDDEAPPEVLRPDEFVADVPGPDESAVRARARRSRHLHRFRALRRFRIGQRWTITQLIGGVLIAGVFAYAATWYVPRVMSSDHKMFTGTVSSSGIVMLNFQNSGVLSTVKVQPGESVHKGQVLAAEYAPNVSALVQADEAAITAVRAKIAELKALAVTSPATAPADNAEIASQKAQLAMANARLITDRMTMTETEIVAPSGGVIVSTNGQPGEAVSASGVRDYAAAQQVSAQQVSAQQQPQFSLFPEGPQSISRATLGGSSLPVIALRVSSSWQVVVLIPENWVQSIKSSQAVTISVPAARLKHVHGVIRQVLPRPAATSAGPLYQAIITISSDVTNPPLDGMAANVQLAT